ncbi:MAG: hypothetical protein JW781_09320 [Deltaproteobacteria bacterium]|nr:hypothetical protein [Candidatus Anaeroferrophillacea bacterium]
MTDQHHDRKHVAVKMKLTDGSLLFGDINLLTEGAMHRLSELFTRRDNPFIVVFNATNKQGTEGQTYIVGKAHIVWVSPADGS